MTDAKVVEKKIYEDGKKEYASKGLAGTALGIGIGGLALALLNGNGRGVFGSLGGSNMPENVNINTYGANSSSNQPTALQVMEKECADEVKLLTDMFGLKLDTANKFYAMRETDIAEKFGLYKSQVDAINAETAERLTQSLVFIRLAETSMMQPTLRWLNWRLRLPLWKHLLLTRRRFCSRLWS